MRLGQYLQRILMTQPLSASEPVASRDELIYFELRPARSATLSNRRNQWVKLDLFRTQYAPHLRLEGTTTLVCIPPRAAFTSKLSPFFTAAGRVVARPSSCRASSWSAPANVKPRHNRHGAGAVPDQSLGPASDPGESSSLLPVNWICMKRLWLASATTSV